MNPEQCRAIVHESAAISGWFSPEASMLFGLINAVQKQLNITGDIFEIGCHHGKSSVLLSQMLNAESEVLCVCDIFENQKANPSVSGSGDLGVFMSNISRIGVSEKLKIFKKSSGELTPAEVGGNYRFFHIDGGHNSDEALSDLRLGAACIKQDGVIVLDDAFRSEWPGVTEALIRFLDEYDQFSSVVVGFNKLVIVKKLYLENYVKHILNESNIEKYNLGYPWRIKSMNFMGSSMQIFFLPSGISSKSMRVRLESFYRKNQWMRNNLMIPARLVVRSILRSLRN